MIILVLGTKKMIQGNLREILREIPDFQVKKDIQEKNLECL